MFSVSYQKKELKERPCCIFFCKCSKVFLFIVFAFLFFHLYGCNCLCRFISPKFISQKHSCNCRINATLFFIYFKTQFCFQIIIYICKRFSNISNNLQTCLPRFHLFVFEPHHRLLSQTFFYSI